MQAPPRDTNVSPGIKCSDCGQDIDIAVISEHTCGTSTPAVSLPQPFLPRTDSSQSLGKPRATRPLLPKIDAAAAFRPPVFQGELTPASSEHSSMVSPLSAGSGTRPPWPVVRKGSLPVSRRPPSPELTNLDCAFPPFPLPSRSTTTKRDRSATQRSDTLRSRSRDASASSRQHSRVGQLSRAGSSNNLPQTAQDAQLSDRRRPSTPSSRADSVSTRSDSRQQSLEKLPELQITPSEESMPMTASPTKSNEMFQAGRIPPPLFRANTEPPLQPSTPDPGLSAFNFGTSQNTMIQPTETNNDLIFNSSRIEDKQRNDSQPSYKSKAPPPISGHPTLPPLSKMRSPTAPQPASPGVFSATFGKLFGRRPSQSTNSRRSVVRQALSDEPDIYEDRTDGQSVISPDSDKSFLTAEPSPMLPVTPLTPVHEEALKALEGEIPAPTVAPVVVVEPATEEEAHESALVTPFEPIKHARISTIVEELPVTVIVPDNDSTRRDSTDSASSYGSIGFSEHSSSSRSSSPQIDSLHLDPSETPISGQLKTEDVDVPAPLRPRVPPVPADAAAEPAPQQGDLSPPENPVKPVTPSTPKAKSKVPNKGICRGCSKVILATQKSVSSADGLLSGRYHKECFVCHTCKASFPTAEFYVHDDHPYCAYHYHELENSLCATCGKGIEGLYMETANVAGRGKEKHHPECLKCTTCHVRLDHDYFELSGRVYCERDAFRLASLPKSRDNMPSRPSPLIREYISSGQDPGMVKGRNFPERRVTRLMNMT
ncbi:hypothetical protein PV08_04973 [Exophiala spinifera]|uniref:LIM zinc-binding domain-containing protein n=1 Tax=Exophiala spinifera TaxID=91928 RepID=A0A0D2BFJ8_9EURO|nr:uncharacterized protein PV08_04973 [Exophiala spinifera]KIW17778.1 hypothetical protein PV08_04973 [Exophiala spinifera]